MSPSKPSRRNACTPRRAASDAPTTAMERTATVTSGAAGLLDGDRLLRAPLHRLLDLGPQLLARRLVEDVEEVVVTHLEHLGRHRHAHRVGLAPVEVDHHPERHVGLPSSRATPAGPGCLAIMAGTRPRPVGTSDPSSPATAGAHSGTWSGRITPTDPYSSTNRGWTPSSGSSAGSAIPSTAR